MITCQLPENKIKTIDDVIDILRMAARQSNAVDAPEGSRYIVFSETLINEIIGYLILSKDNS